MSLLIFVAKNGTLVATKETKVKVVDSHSFLYAPQIKKKNSWNNLNIYPADRSIKTSFYSFIQQLPIVTMQQLPIVTSSSYSL